MDATIAPGALVLVRHDRHHPCAHHRIREVPLFQNVGMDDGLDSHRGEHRVVVVFWGIHSPIFGESWVDAFRRDELVVVEADDPPAA